MEHREFLRTAGASFAAFSVPSRLLAAPESILANGNKMSLECLGDNAICISSSVLGVADENAKFGDTAGRHGGIHFLASSSWSRRTGFGAA
jgi:hypothetical protein